MTAFDPVHTGAGIALSAGNLHALFASGVQNSTRASLSYDCSLGGKLSWKFHRTADGSSENYPAVGLARLADDAGTPFTGLGMVGYVMSPTGWSFVDGSFSGVVLIHGMSVTPVAAGDRISGRTDIVCILDAAAGTLAIYGIDGAGGQHLAYTITGITGVIFPTLGFGGAGALPTEAYDVDFTYVPAWAPSGTISYFTASTPVPVAAFTATPLTGTAPVVTPFTDTSTNAPTSWLWVFGDGATSTLQNPTHTYATPGVYTVSLTATNAAGSSTKTVPNYVVVSAAPAAGLPTLMSRAPISAVLLGITAGVRCGAAAGAGDGYAVISPIMRTVTVVSLATPGVPAIRGTITLPLRPKTISVDTSDGLTLYVYGSKTLWVITLASLVPTLSATHDMPASGGGGVDLYSLPGGAYQGTIGPFLRGGHSVSNATTTFVHDPDRQLLYIYTRSASSPYLTLNTIVATSGIQGVRSMRLGVVETLGGSDARLFIVTAHHLYTFALDGTLLLTTRNDASVLHDYLAVQDPISSAYKAHLAGAPYIEGQDDAPLYGVDENFLGALDNADGTIVVSANAKLGRLTVWQ